MTSTSRRVFSRREALYRPELPVLQGLPSIPIRQFQLSSRGPKVQKNYHVVNGGGGETGIYSVPYHHVGKVKLKYHVHYESNVWKSITQLEPAWPCSTAQL